MKKSYSLMANTPVNGSECKVTVFFPESSGVKKSALDAMMNAARVVAEWHDTGVFSIGETKCVSMTEFGDEAGTQLGTGGVFTFVLEKIYTNSAEGFEGIQNAPGKVVFETPLISLIDSPAEGERKELYEFIDDYIEELTGIVRTHEDFKKFFKIICATCVLK